MLKSDEKTIQAMRTESPEFSDLFNQHIQLEQDLEALYSLRYLPPEVETKIKEIKVVKLKGKDRMHQLIAEYNNN